MNQINTSISLRNDSSDKYHYLLCLSQDRHHSVINHLDPYQVSLKSSNKPGGRNQRPIRDKRDLTISSLLASWSRNPFVFRRAVLSAWSRRRAVARISAAEHDFPARILRTHALAWAMVVIVFLAGICDHSESNSDCTKAAYTLASLTLARAPHIR